MIELPNAMGEVCARVEVVQLGSHVSALRHVWIEGVGGVPEAVEWRTALGRLVAECSTKGVRRIEVRIVVEQQAGDPATNAERAAAHREACRSMGFRPGESRVEYIVPLADAIAALESPAVTGRLAWRLVATEPGRELEQAADVMQAVATGDPDFDAEDDALDFLLARRGDPTLPIGPESLQVGSLEGVDAGIVAASVRPSTGWCSLYYMGVVPSFRGRGLGREVMLHGLRVLHAMGGRTYHDGTASQNGPARSLFRRIAERPTRELEQWRLEN
jgi:ribosomal protein S18 acetylase RimI-like enzyme